MEYVPAKTIIRKNKDTSWFGSDYNMNLYRGCCHGCIYCDSRSECYHVDSFDTVKAKENALLTVRDELRRKVQTGVIGTGAMSDPYNPFESQELLTRHSLELIDAFGFGISMLTKSSMILRDTDVFQTIKEHSPVLCMMTITTYDDELSGKIEPGVPVSTKRFEVTKKLADAGIFSGVVMTPVLPFLEDSEENLRHMIHMTKEHGGKFLYASFGVTLRDIQRDYYYEQLDKNFPDMGLRDRYERTYGSRYICTSRRAKRLWAVLAEECEKAGLLYQMRDIIHAYKKNYQYEQLSLFL